MNLRYILPRVIRHFMPQPAARLLLRRGWIIHPGQETASPQAAVLRYRQALESRGISWRDKRVLVFGYGGNFAVGCELLEAGAGRVILCDKFAPPDDARNAALLPRFEKYLLRQGNRVLPRSEALSLLQADIRQVSASGGLEPVDLVFSSSVFEHLDDVKGITRALAEVMHSGGAQLHFIDLRDHFFRYPFEMLCYSEAVWRNWLNPGSHHNRYRLTDYRRVFELYFEKVSVEALAKDEAAFRAAYPRIRPEFLTGETEIDAVTLIQVIASAPRQKREAG